VTRILVGGTTAEFFSLTMQERLTLLKLGREYFPGLIIFNISGDSSAATVELAQRAQRYGADAVICLPPYYYAGAPEAGLIKYFTSISVACELPLYLYNFPKHTGNPLTPEILKKVPHAGIKDSCPDLSLIDHTAHYLLGGDSRIVEAYKAGARGFVPGLPNVFPEPYLALEQALTSGDAIKAEALQAQITQFKKTLPKISGIVVVKKYLSSILASYPETVRPPLDATLPTPFDTGNKLI
jgi:dihydrodipicolinate synthase/N-acetylneuraminate lyase